MNVSLIDFRDDLDCCTRKYRRVIYNTLLTIKPKFCLEIGTHIYQSSKVFSRYIQEQCLEGKLITADISTCRRDTIPPHRVYPVMVYPHESDIDTRHGGIDIFYKDYLEKLEGEPDAFDINIEIIDKEMGKQGIGLFDFTFVDSDHSKVGFMADLQIAQRLTTQDGYILIDDIKDQNHPGQIEVYNTLKENGSVFYEFENFCPNPGMSLIKNSELIL